MRKRSFITAGLITVITFSVFFFSFRAADQFNETTNDVLIKSRILYKVLENVMNNYVDDVDMSKIIDTAINSIVTELDPHSNYLPPRNYDRMNERFMGYEGIGVQFRMVDKKVTVLRVMRNGPSQKAGLILGDRIVGVEGESIVGKSQDEIPLLLKGPRGTRVNVTIERLGVDKPIDITITRGRTILESVKYYFMIDKTTGFLKLDLFSRTTAADIEFAITNLEAQGMERLIFDLRGNGGGLLSQAVEVADKFLSGGNKIVETKGRIPSANSIYNARTSPNDFTKPLIVLIDEGSASASEVVSGALQDNDRAIVIGKDSFGKGLMQNQFMFEDKSALVLTIGRWYTPLGRLIQKNYDDKSRDEYRNDARNDSLTTLREMDEDRPKFTTPKGRIVYGGGGIKPDFKIESTNFVSGYASNLAYSPANELPIFQHAQEYAIDNKNKWKDVYDFMKNYKLEGKVYEDLKNSKHIVADVFTHELTDKYKDDIEKFFKARVAEFLWGDDGYIKVSVTNDNVLEEAIKHFDAAEKLIQK